MYFISSEELDKWREQCIKRRGSLKYPLILTREASRKFQEEKRKMKVTKEIEDWVKANYCNVSSVDFILETGNSYLADVSFGDRTKNHFAGSQWIEIPREIVNPHADLKEEMDAYEVSEEHRAFEAAEHEKYLSDPDFHQYQFPTLKID